MPAPINLSGRTFGKLLVLAKIGRTTLYGGCALYRCRCDCGVELELPAKRLGYAEWIRRHQPRWIVTACEMCRGHDCPVCGIRVPMTERAQRPTCSPECEHIRYCQVQMRHWRKRLTADPDLPRKMHAAKREKAAVDPAYAAKLKIWEAKRIARHRARMNSDAEYAERYRSRRNAEYARDAVKIRERRRKRLDAMTPDQLAVWLDRARVYGRRYGRKRHAKIVAHPEQHARYLDLMKEYRRRRAAAKALGDLAHIQTKLEKRGGTINRLDT